MKKVPFPKFEGTDEEIDKASEEFHENVGQLDWRGSPEEAVKTFDRLLKEHGLEVRVYKAQADSLFFDLVKKED